MASKTVSLRESAYRKLKNLKREGESFSDAVERISSAQSPEQFEGSYPEIGEVKEELQEQREDFSTREMERYSKTHQYSSICSKAKLKRKN